MLLDDLSLFVTIANVGGLKKAAEALGIPPATVTRRLQNLERRLHCQLLHRSAQQFHLTLQGEALLKDCGDLVGKLEERLERFGSSVNHLSGKIKLLAPSDLAREPLSKLWSSFLIQHQDIEIEFVLDNSLDDIRMTQADFAIRIGPQKNSSLHQVRIASIRTILVSTPAYQLIHGTPKVPDDLVAHQLIPTSALRTWHLSSQESNKEFALAVNEPKAVVNEIGLVKRLILDGVGISLLPLSEVFEEIEQNKLVQILPEWEGQQRDMNVVWANGKHLNQRSRLLISNLKELVAKSAGFQSIRGLETK